MPLEGRQDERAVMPVPEMAVLGLEYQRTTIQGAGPPSVSARSVEIPIDLSRSDRSHPHTVQDLLTLSLAATNAATDTNDSLSHLDSERREFLEASLQEFTKSAADRMSEYIRILLEDDSQQQEVLWEEVLDQIMDLVDNIDNAKDFHKIGGFRVIPLGLRSGHENIRALTANLVAELSQNNTYIQDKIIETNLLTVLLNMVASDSDPTVQVKSLYAVSCIVRDHEAALQMFSAQHGWSVLLKALQTPVEKLQLKACFLLSCICSQMPTVIDELCDLGYVEQLCSLLTGVSQFPLVEHMLQALLSIASNNKQAEELCSLPQYQLRSTLSNLLETTEKDMDHYKYAQQIKTLVFGSDQEDGEER